MTSRGLRSRGSADVPIRAILFDKDGTLVDFQRTWGPATHAVIAHLAAGDQAVYDRLAAVSGFVTGERRFVAGSPLIAGATPDYGRLWAQALGRPATADSAGFAATATGSASSPTTPKRTPGRRQRGSGLDPSWTSLSATIPALAPSPAASRCLLSRGPSLPRRRRSRSWAIPFTTLSPRAPPAQLPSRCRAGRSPVRSSPPMPMLSSIRSRICRRGSRPGERLPAILRLRGGPVPVTFRRVLQ
jgi:hypothetical protein